MTSPSTFDVGDIVRLRSGSPKMTVSAVTDADAGPQRVSCAWFGESRGLSMGEFDARCLVRALVMPTQERAA